MEKYLWFMRSAHRLTCLAHLDVYQKWKLTKWCAPHAQACVPLNTLMMKNWILLNLSHALGTCAISKITY